MHVLVEALKSWVSFSERYKFHRTIFIYIRFLLYLLFIFNTGDILVMLQVDANTMIVMDSFALPVEGTETRVNAQAQAYEYMAAYTETSKQVGRLENAIGWYHSHPGYGCWLSGIDVSTQMLNQQFQEPFVAIVVSIFFHFY